ncbi:xanthine dehydrogenase accessory factor [Crossiella equi]|uniref:Xanthine dehydrogenase accessory factor n=1 Tax=Crossiella equi TaxID=130796 RepID=A0ABS5AQL6_9PSEU|nr:XdhC family protein [Crossiella equi]MBP2478509.1 xanthine dehydrogenase accessory factor [Crossiella equi]
MLELLPELTRWHGCGRRFAVATVLSVRGSAPRPVGATMAVAEDGEVLGSISGGCVEGAVHELCQEALRTGEPSRHHFGYSDETAFAVGLTCGGELEVFIHPDPPLPPPGTTALTRVVEGPPRWLGTVLPLAAPATTTLLPAVPCGAPHPVTALAEVLPEPRRLIVFGAQDFAAALARAGSFLGYTVTVCDPRPVFATRARFPEAEVVVDWPHRYLASTRVDEHTAICVLTHDPKFDLPVLELALRLPVAYVGAMGSRRACAERLDALREKGMSEAELAGLRSPIGLDLGARTAEETAVSIVAEMIAARRGGTGRPLGVVDGAIHR